MLFAFDTPWYAWPVTGAVVIGSFAILGVYLAYCGNHRLKSLESLGSARIALEEVLNLISLATMPSDNFAGQRFISAGGWDTLASKLNMLEAKIDVLRIYGNAKLAKHANSFMQSIRQFYSKVHNSIVCLTIGGNVKKQKDAGIYLASMLDNKINPYDEHHQQLLSLKKFIGK